MVWPLFFSRHFSCMLAADSLCHWHAIVMLLWRPYYTFYNGFSLLILHHILQRVFPSHLAYRRSDRFSSCSFLFITVTPESDDRQVPSPRPFSQPQTPNIILSSLCSSSSTLCPCLQTLWVPREPLTLTLTTEFRPHLIGAATQTRAQGMPCRCVNTPRFITGFLFQSHDSRSAVLLCHRASCRLGFGIIPKLTTALSYYMKIRG